MKNIWLFLFAVLSFTSVYATWVECPFGLTNDPAPGNCGLYVDTNTDNLCDLSQTWSTAIWTHEWEWYIDACDAWLASWEISSTELKKMTLSQVAWYYNIEATVLMQAIENKVNWKLSLDQSMQDIHDTYSLPMREVKAIVQQVMAWDQNLQDVSIRFNFFGYIKDMYVILVLWWILFMVLYYFFDKLAKQKKRIILSFESNIILLFVPLSSLLRYFLSADPLFLWSRWWYAALWLLWILLISRPLFNILVKKNSKILWLRTFLWFIVWHRKPLGIIMFWVAWMHSFIYLLLRFKLWFFWSNALTWMWASGIVWLITTFVAYITSNKPAKCFLWWRRKKVQMLVYITMIASVLHVVFINFTRWMIMAWFTLVWMILWLWAKKLMNWDISKQKKKC